ncbi:MAG TPA: methyltransferase domain-containing protein [Gemmatimonadaceae bacterium]
MTTTNHKSIEALATSLERRFRTTESVVEIGGREICIVHPASAEDLINERDFERDERLPYWAELWPSSRILGETLLATKGAERSLLELGCGAGLVATCAALAGYSVTATDYYDDALRFTRVNAWKNDAPAPHTFLLDWRNLPEKRDQFDVIVASDVLYERPYGALVAQTIDAFLSRNGHALIADPGRVARDAFLQAAGQLGLDVAKRRDVPFVAGPIRQTITVFDLRRRVNV